MRKTGKKLALILTMAMTLTLFTSCGGKKNDVGGLGDDNKVNNIFNQGKNKDTDNNSNGGYDNNDDSNDDNNDKDSDDSGQNDKSNDKKSNKKGSSKNNKSALQLETYKGDGFSILVPKGWNIMTGGDGVYFWYNIYNPQDESMMVFQYGKLEPFLKSYEAKASWQKWAPITGTGDETFAHAPVCLEKTAKGILDCWSECIEFQQYIGQNPTFISLNNLSIKSCDAYQGKLASLGLPESIAIASCSTATGKKAVITLSTAIFDPGYMDMFMEGIDTYYTSAYNTTGILLPENCDEAYAKALAQCAASLEFDEEFVARANRQSDAVLSDVQQRSAENEALMDEFMRKWGY